MMVIQKGRLIRSIGFRVCLGIALASFAGVALSLTIGTMASTITGTFTAVGKLITAGSYVAGLGFAVGAIMKFKAHKDNPTQIPIGTPIGLILIAAALLFMPTLLETLGATMFGTTGKTAGPSGTQITGTSSS